MFERMAPEQHDTLPDIPEPGENPFLAGHKEAREALAAAYRSGKLHHALLFAGPPGIGKATLAFHFAQHIFANPDQKRAPGELALPDPVSQGFRQAAQGAHAGLLHLTRPYVERDKKFKTVITVDEIRRVSRFLSLTPPDGGYRVVLVDPADDMNISAANALLKNLEEPPARTLFILIAHSLGRLLPTIRSRCQVVKLQPLQSPELEDLLGRLGADMPDEAGQRQLLIERSRGSARSAVLLTQFGGLELTQVLDRLMGGRSFDIAEAHQLAEAAAGRDRQVQFDILNRACLDLLSDTAADAASAGDIRIAERLAAEWDGLARAIGEAETYNLDRKQHVLGMLARLHRALNA
ncbi:DNA polymerase III subunit delta' [Nitratireductor luteus]|uniref:DNA polymerase III subunit delta' n=1 Tax=Nitratireductor luteus TaxID=2976980 RepID=UPI00223F954A|nr:DNA polymerase III subunit delta' [Nitratireductor luteus]